MIDLRGVPVGVVPSAPTGHLFPTVLVAIMGPYPMSYGKDGRTTLDDTLVVCATVGAIPVFIPDLITAEEKVSTVPRIRLRGHTAMRNEGVRIAMENGYDYLLLIENDSCLPPNTLQRLLQHDKDIILPRLTYPDFEPIEELCYGPADRPRNQDGLLRLIWAAHSCILFKVEALRRIAPPVWQGFQTEGEDHQYWQKQGIQPFMDMDTPIRVLQLARGHKDFYEIPFRAHLKDGKACYGPVYLASKSRDIGLYLCKVEGCEYEMVTLKPRAIKPEELSSVALAVEMAHIREHWAQRAPYYAKLAWPKEQGYLDALMVAADVQADDYVLDVGTGTGRVACEAAKKSFQVIGLDVSPDMLAEVNGTKLPNQEFVEGDIRAIPYPRGRFDKVFARMVVHGLVGEWDLAKAMKECYRVLVPGGKFIFSEGTPPNRKTQQWYSEMFKLKEVRRTMTIPRMRTMMQRVGFKDIKATTYVMKDFSIANWLENSGMATEQKEEIMGVHRRMPLEVQRAYQALFTKDDVLIQSHFAIVVGEK